MRVYRHHQVGNEFAFFKALEWKRLAMNELSTGTWNLEKETKIKTNAFCVLLV